MRQSLRDEVHRLWPAWFCCVLLPLPATVLLRSDDGVPWRLGCFSVGCAWLVADAFHRRTGQTWREHMLSVGVALLASAIAFSALCLALNGSRDWLMPFKALYVSALALCIVPYVTLVTENRLAGVVLSMSLVFGLKLLGCAIVVLIHGWDASERGYTTTPWTHPNLLVWLFWSFSAALSPVFYFLGARKFQMIRGATSATHPTSQSPQSLALL